MNQAAQFCTGCAALENIPFYSSQQSAFERVFLEPRFALCFSIL